MNDRSAKVWSVMAEQRWSEKWGTMIRGTHIDYDTPGYDDTTVFGASLTHYYSPSIKFVLAYDSMDYGNGNPEGARNGGDGIWLFKTYVYF
jgi:hypothetical protein